MLGHHFQYSVESLETSVSYVGKLLEVLAQKPRADLKQERACKAGPGIWNANGLRKTGQHISVHSQCSGIPPETRLSIVGKRLEVLPEIPKTALAGGKPGGPGPMNA